MFGERDLAAHEGQSALCRARYRVGRRTGRHVRTRLRHRVEQLLDPRRAPAPRLDLRSDADPFRTGRRLLDQAIDRRELGGRSAVLAAGLQSTYKEEAIAVLADARAVPTDTPIDAAAQLPIVVMLNWKGHRAIDAR